MEHLPKTWDAGIWYTIDPTILSPEFSGKSMHLQYKDEESLSWEVTKSKSNKKGHS